MKSKKQILKTAKQLLKKHKKSLTKKEIVLYQSIIERIKYSATAEEILKWVLKLAALLAGVHELKDLLH